MKNTKEFVNRFRYAILAVLVVVTLAYSVYLYRVYVPGEQPEPPTVNVTVTIDGNIRMDGALYDNVDKLKPKIAQLQSEHPDISFSIHAAYGAQMEPISKAVVLLRQAGARTVWVVNEKPGKNQTP